MQRDWFLRHPTSPPFAEDIVHVPAPAVHRQATDGRDAREQVARSADGLEGRVWPSHSSFLCGLQCVSLPRWRQNSRRVDGEGRRRAFRIAIRCGRIGGRQPPGRAGPRRWRSSSRPWGRCRHGPPDSKGGRGSAPSSQAPGEHAAFGAAHAMASYGRLETKIRGGGAGDVVACLPVSKQKLEMMPVVNASRKRYCRLPAIA